MRHIRIECARFVKARQPPTGTGTASSPRRVIMAEEDDGRVLPTLEGGQRRALMPGLDAAAPAACVIDTPRPRMDALCYGVKIATGCLGRGEFKLPRPPVDACYTAETPQPIGGRRHPCQAASSWASPARFQCKRWTQCKRRRRCTACQSHCGVL